MAPMNRLLRSICILLPISLLISASACGSSGHSDVSTTSTPASGGVAPNGLILAGRFEQQDFKFSPDTGGFDAHARQLAVEVHNASDQGHTFTIDELHINVGVAPGETKYITIPNQTGTYTFYCVIHRQRGMTGTLQLIAF